MNAFTFANPSGLWALAALAAVAAFYLFYRRYRPRRVTGLFLWGVPQRGDLGGRKAEAPLLSRAFLFDLLAALFFALSLAEPAWRGANGLPLAIVLDSSFAMRARDRHHDAKRDAALLARSGAGAGRGALVALAAGTPSILFGPGPGGAAATAIEGHEPFASSSDLQAAVDMVRDAYGLGLDIHVFTNREETLLAGADSALTTHVYAGRGGNLAFGEIWRDPDGGIVVAMINYSDSDARAVLRLEAAAGGEPLAETEEFLPAGKRAVASCFVPGVADKTVRLILETGGEDVIAADSVAFAAPVPARVVSYGVTGLSDHAARFVRVALEAAGAVPAGEDGPDLLVAADPESIGRVATLEIPRDGEPVLYPPPLIVDSANRLCRDVRLGDLPWVARDAWAAGAVDAAEVVIAAGGQPLYWRSPDGRLHLNVALESSPLVFSTAWPVLIANLAAEVAAAMPGLAESVYRPGRTLAYRSSGPEPLAFRERGGAAVYTDMPRKAGWYDLLSGGQPVAEVTVLPQYGAASDVRLAADKDVVTPPSNAAAAVAGLTDLRWLAVLAGIVFVSLNWRRKK